MNQDEQRALAIECGAIVRHWTSTVSLTTSELSVYTAAVEAKERERCAVEAYEWAMAYVTADTAPISISDLLRSLK